MLWGSRSKFNLGSTKRSSSRFVLISNLLANHRIPAYGWESFVLVLHIQLSGKKRDAWTLTIHSPNPEEVATLCSCQFTYQFTPGKFTVCLSKTESNLTPIGKLNSAPWQPGDVSLEKCQPVSDQCRNQFVNGMCWMRNEFENFVECQKNVSLSCSEDLIDSNSPWFCQVWMLLQSEVVGEQHFR